MEWITTPNISAEAWRRLLEYANIDLTVEAIARRHGSASNNSLQSNYKKQASHIRVAILQTREYFSAAEKSTLFTSPNHLYYGMVALATAMMLLRGDGEFALDYLRKDAKNRRHGLEFSTNATSGTCHQNLRLLSDTHVSVEDFGHFRCWYRTIPTHSCVRGILKRQCGAGELRSTRILGRETTLSDHQILGKKWDLMSLLRYFPDLYQELRRYGESIIATRVDYEIQIADSESLICFTWNLHDCKSQEDFEAILSQFKALVPFCCDGPHNSTSGIISIQGRSDSFKFEFPSIRETLNNEQLMYAKSLNTHEFVDAYLVAYGLSMLSRYYPDLWIRCIESHCKAAKLIERVVAILMDKAPVLALKLISDQEIVISNHRPPLG